MYFVLVLRYKLYEKLVPACSIFADPVTYYNQELEHLTGQI